jgi:hypothetical protein
MATGFLHPGAMGASLAAICRGARLWCGEGRSQATRERAALAGLEDVGSLEALLARADVIVSVCPPAAALDVATEVAAVGFDGIYVDVNAVSPATARLIGGQFFRFVDGGVVGPPVQSAGSTRLYLCGADADEVAQLWAGSPLETRVVAGGVGAARCKICFAAWTKGGSVALGDSSACCRCDEALLAEWATSMPGPPNSQLAAPGNAPKAWRPGELDEVAASFSAHHLPDGFGTAASEVYERLAGFKDTPGATLADVIEAIRSPAIDGTPSPPG